jgi:hypothetical protein
MNASKHRFPARHTHKPLFLFLITLLCLLVLVINYQNNNPHDVNKIQTERLPLLQGNCPELEYTIINKTTQFYNISFHIYTTLASEGIEYIDITTIVDGTTYDTTHHDLNHQSEWESFFEINFTQSNLPATNNSIVTHLIEVNTDYKWWGIWWNYYTREWSISTGLELDLNSDLIASVSVHPTPKYKPIEVTINTQNDNFVIGSTIYYGGKKYQIPSNTITLPNPNQTGEFAISTHFIECISGYNVTTIITKSVIVFDDTSVDIANISYIEEGGTTALSFTDIDDSGIGLVDQVLIDDTAINFSVYVLEKEWVVIIDYEISNGTHTALLSVWDAYKTPNHAWFLKTITK